MPSQAELSRSINDQCTLEAIEKDLEEIRFKRFYSLYFDEDSGILDLFDDRGATLLQTLMPEGARIREVESLVFEVCEKKRFNFIQCDHFSMVYFIFTGQIFTGQEKKKKSTAKTRK